MNTADKILELSGVNFAYQGKPVLLDINFSLMGNEFLLVTGPNGGGKTTLLKLILGLLKPSAGTIRIFGDKPSNVSRRIGYVPQDTTINRDFPIAVHDVVNMGREGVQKLDQRPAHDVIRESLDLVDMWDYRDRWIGALSGGQRQRVFIARALASEPDILLLDEPTASIDMEGQLKIYEILKRLNERTAMMVVSHDVSALLGFATSVAYVNGALHLHDAPGLTVEALGSLVGKRLHDICPAELLIRIVGNDPVANSGGRDD